MVREGGRLATGHEARKAEVRGATKAIGEIESQERWRRRRQ